MALGKLGKYERVDVLGHGASGIVYLAWDTLLKKQIALKEVDLQAADMHRFLEEARVMDRLHHPNIVRVNGVDTIDNRVVIDMEYVKGQNLQELLRAEGRLPVERALGIAIETLDALDYAHRMHTVHRDIKPANILIGRDGAVKLVDFGLAEILATNSYAGGAGTYAYMAPEDFDEQRRSDHRSDIFAVGVTLYEMLTGLRPFTVTKAKDPFAWRHALLNDEPAPLRIEGLSDEDEAVRGLRAVFARALARDKEARYASAGDFRDDLRAIRARTSPVNAAWPAAVSAAPSHTAVFGTAAAPVAPPVMPFAEPPALATAPIPVEETDASRRRFGRQKPILPARVVVHPSAIGFGEMRKGEVRSEKVHIRFEGGEGRMTGRVVSAPPWVTVSQNGFDRRKQTLTFTAISANVWETGEFQETVKLETSAGDVGIPVGIRVLPPRPRFAEVAPWLVPLYFLTLLPALTVAWALKVAPVAYLVPSAALGSGLLAVMLLVITVAADLGMAERVVCGLLAATMGLVLGVKMRVMGLDSSSALVATAVPIGALLLAELATFRYWKGWSVAVAILSLLTAGTFVSVLNAR